MQDKPHPGLNLRDAVSRGGELVLLPRGALARHGSGGGSGAGIADHRCRGRRVGAGGRDARGGYRDLTVLDLAGTALAVARARLGPRA